MGRVEPDMMSLLHDDEVYPGTTPGLGIWESRGSKSLSLTPRGADLGNLLVVDSIVLAFANTVTIEQDVQRHLTVVENAVSKQSFHDHILKIGDDLGKHQLSIT